MKKLLLLFASLACVAATAQTPRTIRPWSGSPIQNVYFSNALGGGRSLGQAYQNTSGRPFLVTFTAIAFGMSASDSTFREAFCAGWAGPTPGFQVDPSETYAGLRVIAGLTVTANPSTQETMTFLVEPGDWYAVTCGSSARVLIHNWSESAL